MVKRGMNACDGPIGPNAEEQKENFKKGYGFRRSKPVRSPVDHWEHGHIIKGDVYMASKAEVDMIKAKPHGFKGVRNQNSYGNRPARRNRYKG